jgi:hypothetical protein
MRASRSTPDEGTDRRAQAAPATRYGSAAHAGHRHPYPHRHGTGIQPGPPTRTPTSISVASRRSCRAMHARSVSITVM